jgi:hypothetical protein
VLFGIPFGSKAFPQAVVVVFGKVRSLQIYPGSRLHGATTMKIATTKCVASLLALIGAASFANTARAQSYTFGETDSAYITKSNDKSGDAKGGFNLVNSTSKGSTDYDVIDFTAAPTTGTASSLSITLFTAPKADGTYSPGSSNGSASGLVDFYIGTGTSAAVGTADTASPTTNIFTAADTLPTEPGTSGYGTGVNTSYYGGTFYALGQVNLGSALYPLVAGSSDTFGFMLTDPNLIAYLDSQAASRGDVRVFLSDDSTQAGTGAQNSFEGIYSNSAMTDVYTPPSLTIVDVVPSPEVSTVVSMAASLGLLCGFGFYNRKRRLS